LWPLLDPHGYRDSGFGVWDKEQPINRGHNKVVTTTAASAAKVTKIRGYQSSNRCSMRRCCHCPLRTRNRESRISLGSRASLWAHDISISFSLLVFWLSPLFFSSLFFWHKPGNKLSDTKSSPSQSQNKGINTRRTETEMATKHALDQLTTQKTKTKTRIGIRIGIEPSTRIRSKTKQIERLHRMQNEQKNARKAWT